MPLFALPVLGISSLLSGVFMLIKIMTNRNSERLISGIEAVDIHRSTFIIRDDAERSNTIAIGPGVFNETGFTPIEVECYDSPIESREYGSPFYNYKFIDYKKDGQWRRLAVECFAYVCNDDGKTVSKVAVE